MAATRDQPLAPSLQPLEVTVISSGNYGNLIPPDGRWWADRKTLETVWLEFGKILYWELTPFMEFQGEGTRLKESEMRSQWGQALHLGIWGANGSQWGQALHLGISANQRGLPSNLADGNSQWGQALHLGIWVRFGGNNTDFNITPASPTNHYLKGRC